MMDGELTLAIEDALQYRIDCCLKDFFKAKENNIEVQQENSRELQTGDTVGRKRRNPIESDGDNESPTRNDNSYYSKIWVSEEIEMIFLLVRLLFYRDTNLLKQMSLLGFAKMVDG